MKKAVIFGYGNVGMAAIEAVCASGDFELAGVVSKSRAGKHAGVPAENVIAVGSDTELGAYDVAILALPSRQVPDMAEHLLSRGIPTVDSFDIHSEILSVRNRLDPIARANNASAVIAAGWDPGTDSAVRALMTAMSPCGVTYTDFGPGMSMGHSVAVKAITGVRDALSMTMPVGAGVHRRMVYIELEDGADFHAVSAAIKSDAYFVHDDTHVMAVDSVSALKDVGHGVNITRKGVSGCTHNQRFGFTMSINNPALTGQILLCAARAALRCVPGCYTLIEIPPVDFLEMNRDDAIRTLV